MARRLRRRDGDEGDAPLAEVVPLLKGVGGGRTPPAAARPHRLPSFWSSFVGRDRERDELSRLLRSRRLITLTGPGGIGKTRLAVEVARQAATPAVFVDLSPLHEPNLVGEHIAAAFGLGELRERDLAEALLIQLPAGAVLVLDNCEHLVGACASSARRLLTGCPDLRILATSQQRLGVTGEMAWSVPPLDLHEAAVPLFCERAAAVKREFAPSETNLDSIVEICRRLDANPLAIELAAARVEVLSPAEIADRLEERFELLGQTGHAAEGRHETLAGALAWSVELLGGPERTLLRRLSVFAGSFTLSAVEDVCAGGDVGRDDVLDRLSALVARSFVVADTSGAKARYRLLETVRHYAAEALAAAGEADAAGERYTTWCARLAALAAAADEPADALDALEPDLDNLRAGLEWCVAQERHEAALRLASDLMVVWEPTGRFAEARDWLVRALAIGGSAPPSVRARALYNAGFAALVLGDLEAAGRDVAASLELSEKAGDPPPVVERTRGLLSVVSTFGDGPASVETLEVELAAARERGEPGLGERLTACAHLRLFRGEPVAAERHFQELLTVARQRGDDTMAATALVGLGAAAVGQGDCERAARRLHEGVTLAAEAADGHTEVLGAMWLGELANLTGDNVAARAGLEECLARARLMGAPYSLARTLLVLGRVDLDEGAVDAARRHFDDAVAMARPAALAQVEAAALDGRGHVALADGDLAVARGFFEQALAAAQRADEKTATARTTYHLAELARAEGDLDRALSLHDEALKGSEAVADRVGVSASFEAHGSLAIARGSTDHAARLFGAADALRLAGGWARSTRHQARYDADLAGLRAGMAPDAFETAWREGAALSLQEAVSYATRGRGARSRARTGFDSLTATERDVVRLIGEGLENAEIAERLFISPRTVHSHLRRVYPKLGVTSRRELRQAMAERRPRG